MREIWIAHGCSAVLHGLGTYKNMSNPLVSVIMNCHNGAQYLREAIDSVVAQTYPNWEIVFWDNQSTDDSAEIFKSYQGPQFRYFLAPEYTALGEARNLAIQQSRGELVAFLDCDDLWLSRKLEKQVPLFQKGPVGIVICDTIFFNNKKDIRQLYKRKKPPTEFVFKELLGAYFISMETPIIRRSALSDLDHWFDPRFEMIEEYDFFVRLGLKWEVAYVDEVLAKWRVHSSSWTWSKSELFPVETRLFLDKMNNLIPDFKFQYVEEFSAVRLKIALQEAIISWRMGNPKRAREILKPFRRENLLAGLITSWSWLPFKTFDFVNRMRVGLVS